MLIKGENPDFIRGGEKDHAKASTLSNDQFYGETFDYGLSNPPYGVDWKKDKKAVDREEQRGFAGRFGAGTPRISDGQLLFLQHLVSKMNPVKDGGARVAIVHNGSPLFTGDAGSGESEIRRWILEKDLLETIIALPDQLFYNTGINTYLWFLTNRKREERQGKVQLIDARTFSTQLVKNLGNKRNEIDPKSREFIRKIYLSFEEGEYSKIFNTTNFGYRQITIERPLHLDFQVSDERIEKLKTRKTFEKLAVAEQTDIIEFLKAFPHKELFTNRDRFLEVFEPYLKEKKLAMPLKKAILNTLSERNETADICVNVLGKPEPDSELQDHENVPLAEDIHDYFDREVRSYIPDAWINKNIRDHKDGKIGQVGYEIPFTRYFYQYKPPHELEAIETDIEDIENELLELLKKL